MGNDKIYRDKVTQTIVARRYRLVDDHQTAFEWARFLTRALGIVIDPKDLANEMNYVPEKYQKEEFLAQEIASAQYQWKKSKMLHSDCVG